MHVRIIEQQRNRRFVDLLFQKQFMLNNNNVNNYIEIY